MNENQKTAIEEAAKLPTAEEFFKTWCNETKRSGGVLIGSSVREFLAAYESHTAAHTAALREELDASKEDLWSERIINEALRNSLQDRDDFIKLHIDLGVKLNEENKSLTKKIDSLKKMADAAIKKMVDAEQKYHNLDLKRTSELKGLNERVKELEAENNLLCQFNEGDKVDFLFKLSNDDPDCDFGTIYKIHSADFVVVRPYRSRTYLRCALTELQHTNELLKS